MKKKLFAGALAASAVVAAVAGYRKRSKRTQEEHQPVVID